MINKPLKRIPKYNLKILEEFPDLNDWLKQISRYRKVEDFVFISDYKNDKLIRLRIFTKDHQYSISARLPMINEYSRKCGDKSDYIDDGYLGCMVKTRKPRAGENWNRGNDLADGSYSEETWQEIVNDIIAYELVKVVRHSADKEEK